MRKRSIHDVIEGYFISHVVHQFYQRGVFERFKDGRDTAAIAREFGYDPDAFHTLLRFVQLATDLLVFDNAGSVRLNAKYAGYRSFGFHLDKFIGAYGPPIRMLDKSLESPALGKPLVDQKAFSAAFGQLNMPGPSLTAQILRSFGVTGLLDLGCGTASLIRELCEADALFRGWGIDSNIHMCDEAMQRIRLAGLSDRVTIMAGDVRELGRTALPVREIDAVHCGSLLNEFFRKGPSQASRVVKSIRRMFPRKMLFVADYYGKLSNPRPPPSTHSHAVIHDVAQAVTGQGIPPRNRRGWYNIYKAAECDMIHAYEGTTDGIDWFVHVVRL